MEKKKGYSMFERDKLDPADSMRIERNIYFEEQTADLSGLTALPLEQLQALREEYAAAEQAAFEALQEQAAAWDEQAGKTLAIDKAIEYVRTPEATHTANQWEATDYGKHISNRVYQMRYHISENTRYDREKEKSIPYSWTLSWSIYTNSPHNYGQAKIAGQERKVFADKAAMEKYLNGRIKAYQHLFTEVSPPIPPEYAEHFKVNGQLLPGYAIEGEERAQPNYSFRNTVLIAMQKPDASLLAGFSAWKNNFERNVMRGQKGIKIIAPSPYKIKQEMQKIDPHTQKPIIGKDGKPVTEEKEITIPAYKVVSVFDVSQTEGKELPDIAVDELTGDVDRYKDFFAALEKTSPVPIAFENIEGGSHGYYHLEDKRIAINEGMSELQTLKTAIHEIAHAKLHDIDLNAPKDEQQPHVDRRTREVEAESVAYTVCQHYGLDTSDYSFGYVAGWSSGRELSELKSSLETIRSAAAEIINSIDENLAELQKAQDKEQTAGKEQPTREGQEAAPQPEAPKKADTAGKEKPEAAPKEAFTPETIYRVRRNPYSDSRENSHLLQAYVTQENGRAKMGDVLYTGTPEKCRELMGQLKSGELTEGDVKQLYAKAQETAQTTGQDKDTFSIYQIKGGDETRDFRFEPYDRLQAAGNVVDRANYELVYSAPLAPETSLEDIYTRFNIDHPKDFKGHSLSVSDVVVLHQNGQDTAHYVDSVGFRQVPEFLQEQKQLTPDELTTGETIQTPRGTFHVTAMSREQIEAAGYGFHHQSDDGKYLIMGNGTRAFAVAAEQPEKANPLKHIEDTVEQNDNNFDGIINNTPTVDELEAKVKAGETISLVDLANAVKADKERGKEAKPEKKPSIRAQLRADKEKAQKKNAKQKLQDLERS